MLKNLSRNLVLTVTTLAAVCLILPPALQAGSALLRNSAVGGVSISLDGVVSELTPELQGQTRESLETFLHDPPTRLSGATQIRKVSLKQLEAALSDSIRNRGGEIPQEIMYLGGLQRVQYVFVYPELNDIVLAGPAEGWKVDAAGNVVGETTGRPVLHLDDLLVALRSVHEARVGNVLCSINPTEEGVRNVQMLMARTGRRRLPNIDRMIEEACGPQDIVIDGVPETSHFARVMLAADYRMKRIAMQLDPSPVQQLPSFLGMVQNSRVRFTGSNQPRWWLACNYETLGRSEDGLAWQLRGPGVKVMTEENALQADGSIAAQNGRTSPLAQAWADRMTEHYEALADELPIFAELRNIMDLCVIAALIEKEGLRDKAQMGELTNLMQDAVLDTYHAPKSLATKCSIVKRGRDYVFMASGGIQVDSWQAASESEVDPQLNSLHEQSADQQDKSDWVWN